MMICSKLLGDKFKRPVDHRDDDVHKVFSTIVKRRLRDTMNQVREIAKDKSNSENPLDWRPYKPDWFDGSAWVKALECWGSEEWQRISQINSNNRNSIANGEFPKHTCGSVTSAVHEDRMLKRRPTPLELYIRTHCTTSRDYVDNRARDAVENYNDIVEERWLASERSDFHPDTWTKVTGGIRKGRVFSLGSSQAAMELKNSSDRSRVRSQQAEIEVLKKQLAEVEENRKKENRRG